ncbi:MAG TPA: response regulator [Geminicoccus sp.]|jgi:DNA-binding response OmpR family regulator|uniref:response regulator n=1 Tax=Geminicoccus sp. TaxID=2024832 RepID=UPI002E37A5B1|nr:response regulator [Geminicoccus sp.]HEX2526554.1 response regulator [Geminicoccus sp.]
MIVLIAEDETTVAFALEWALRTAGHEVLGPAYTIDEALKSVSMRRPDLALVNLVLKGGEDGAILAKELQRRHATPTIFVSADIRSARARRDVALGLIKKPYDAEMVPAIVRYLKDLEQGRRPIRVPPELEMF